MKKMHSWGHLHAADLLDVCDFLQGIQIIVEKDKQL